MARAVIGKLVASWAPDTDTWSVDAQNSFPLQHLRENLRQLANGQPLQVKVTIERHRKGRSLAQNDMMWALLAILAGEISGGRSGDTSAEDLYIEMLEQYGSDFDYLQVPVKALPILRQSYRIVKVIELLDGDRCTVKCGMGSSGFDTKQMSDMIDGIFDRLAALGVNDAEVTDYWRSWKGLD